MRMAVAELSEPAVMEKTHSSSHSAWVRPLRMKEPWAGGRGGGVGFFCVSQEGMGRKRTSMSFWSGTAATNRRSTISLASLLDASQVSLETGLGGRGATRPHRISLPNPDWSFLEGPRRRRNVSL